jgi:hypothetical protein
MNQTKKYRPIKIKDSEPSNMAVSQAIIHVEQSMQGNMISPSQIWKQIEIMQQHLYNEIKPNPYEDVSLYLCSIVSRFLNIYFATCYPHHYLVTSDFQIKLPELVKNILINPNEINDTSFLLFAVLANSAMVMMDPRRAEEFYNRAQLCLQQIDLSIPNFNVACGYCHLGYQNQVYSRYDEANMYGKLAFTTVEALGLQNTELYNETILRIGYSSFNYQERITCFSELWSKPHQTARLIGALGSVHTELRFNPNPDYGTLIKILQSCQQIVPNDWKFLFDMYTTFLLLLCYRKSGLTKLVPPLAEEIVKFAQSPELRYSCVIVTTYAMREVADIHFEQNRLDLIEKDLRIISTFAHFPLGYNLFQEVYDRLLALKVPAVQLTLDPFTVEKDLESIYPNAFSKYGEMQFTYEKPVQLNLENLRSEVETWMETGFLQ